ncbi:MAG: LAGLIDADG family homing endonuclease, partial [Minisyncoccota bacterium]
MGIKYAVAEDFFDTWSDSMAYVLGYIYADGSLEDSIGIRGKYLRITSTDSDRIVAIKRLLQAAHPIVVERRVGNRKPLYLLRIGSTRLYTRLFSMGVTPRKSHTMQFPLVPQKNVPAFVRGYFDGDGGVY